MAVWTPAWKVGPLPKLTLHGRRTATMQERATWTTDAEAIQVAKECCFMSGPFGMPRLAVMMATNPRIVIGPYVKGAVEPVAGLPTGIPEKWFTHMKDGTRAKQGGTYINYLMESGYYAEAHAAATVKGRISGVSFAASHWAEWHAKDIIAKINATNAQAAQNGTHPFRSIWYDSLGTFSPDNVPGFWTSATNPGWDPHLLAAYTKTNWLRQAHYIGDLSRNQITGFTNINAERLWIVANGLRGVGGGSAGGASICGHFDQAMTEGWLINGIGSTIQTQAAFEADLQTMVDAQLNFGCVAEPIENGTSAMTAAQQTQHRRFTAACNMMVSRGLITFEYGNDQGTNPAAETLLDPDLYGNTHIGGSKQPLDFGDPIAEPAIVAADWPTGHRVPVGTANGQASAVGLYICMGTGGTILANRTNASITYKAPTAYTLVPTLQATAATSYAAGASVPVAAGSAVFLKGPNAGGSTGGGARWPAVGIMFGSYVDLSKPANGETQAEIQARETAFSRLLALDTHFYGQGAPSDGFPEWDLASGRCPIITTAFGWGQATFPGYAAAQDGSQDAIYDAWATYLKTLPSTVILRLFQEFNGNWFNFGTDAAGYTTGFAAMWRYIWNRWQAAGVDLGGKIQICWCPNTEANLGISAGTTDAGYPGDQYVDCIGIDLYNKDSGGTGGGASFQTAFSAIYARHAGRGKPFIVPEFGCVDHVLDQRKNYFAAARAYMLGGSVPLLKGIAYWDAVGTSNDPITGQLLEYRTDQTASGNAASATDSFNQWKAISADAGYQAFMGTGGSSGTAPANLSAPGQVGTPRAGQTLYSVSGRWTGSPTPILTYQWQVSDTGTSGWTDIAGADTGALQIALGGGTPTTYAADDFSDAQTDTWLNADTGGAWAVEQGATADFDKVGGQGTISAAGANTGKMASLNVGRAELDATVDFIFPNAAAGGNLQASIGILFADTSNYYRLNVINFAADGSVTANPDKVVAGVATSIGTAKSLGTPAAGTVIHVRIQREITGTKIRAKAWTGATEPSAWDWDVADAAISAAGKLTVRLFRGASNTNPSPQLKVDNLTATSLTVTGSSGFTGLVGKFVRVRETADNGIGAPVSAFSPSSAVIVAGTANDPVFSTRPTISGTALEQGTLTVNPGTVTGTPTPVLSYQWQESGNGAPTTFTNITGETAQTYTPPIGQAGKTVRAVVTAAGNVTVAATTAKLGPITAATAQPINDTPPTITGQHLPGAAYVGDTLTVDTGAWTNVQQLDIQWQQSTNGGSTWTNMTDTDATHVVVQADQGKRLRAVVTGSAPGASPVAVPTAGTPAVTLPPAFPNLTISVTIE